MANSDFLEHRDYPILCIIGTGSALWHPVSLFVYSRLIILIFMIV